MNNFSGNTLKQAFNFRPSIIIIFFLLFFVRSEKKKHLKIISKIYLQIKKTIKLSNNF